MIKIFDYDFFFLIKKIPYLWFFAFINGFSNFIIFVILANHLSPENYGLFYSSFILISFFASFSGFGMETLILKLFGKFKNELYKFKNNFLKYFFLTSFISIFSYLIIIYLLKDIFHITYSLLLIPLIFNLFLTNIVNLKYQLEKKFVYLSIWNFIHNFLRLSLVIIFYFFFIINIQNTIIIFIISSIIMILLSIFEISKIDFKLIDSIHDFQLNKDNLVDNSVNNIFYIIKNSIPYGLAGLFFLIYYQIDIIFLKILKNDFSVSIYGACFIILSAIYIFPSVISSKIFSPSIHKYSNDKKFLIKNLKFILPIFFISGIFAFIFIFLLSSLIINLLFSDIYFDAILLLKVLSFAIPIRFLIAILGIFLETNNLIFIKVKLMSIAAISNIILNLLLIPHYDIFGAAVATIITELLLLIMYLNLVFIKIFKKSNI